MATLPLQAIVRYPQQAQAGVSYLMTVDLEFDPQRPQAWTLRREEIAIECQVSSTLFTISPPADPTLILHRYGGTYGSLTFLLKAQERSSTGSIHLTLFDNGLPIGDFALAAQVNARSNTPGTPVVFAETVEQPTAPPESGAYDEEITYDNFDLEIRRAREGYDVRVLYSPVGEAQSTFTLPFTNEEISAFLESSVGQPYSRVIQAASQPLTLQLLGARLYEAVFAGEVGDLFRRSLAAIEGEGRGLRIRLRLADAPALATLPWEYLYFRDLDQFLALSPRTLLVRYLELLQPQRLLAIAEPLSVLAVIAQPTDQPPLAVEREWKQLSAALSDLVNGGMLKLERLAPVTIAGLQQRLRQGDVHILHFVGHGFLDDERRQSAVVFEDEKGYSHQVTSEQLSVLLQDHSPLRLAFLNLDYSAQRDRIQPALAVAQALVQRGLPAAVTLQSPISDRSAGTLAREFYRALVAGYPVDRAISEARRALYVENEQLDWGAPVLYMSSPDGILWQRLPAVRREENFQARKAWAVFVGINNYSDPTLGRSQVAVQDATALYDLLAEEYQVARLLTDDTPEHPPTRANILNELSHIAKEATTDDLLLFYFSGNSSVNDGKSYLLPIDARATALIPTAVDMTRVQELFTSSAAHAKVIIVDSNHSGNLVAQTSADMMTPKLMRSLFEESKTEGIVLMTSCSPGQQSWVSQEEGHSVFTDSLLEALRGQADFDQKGFVTITDVNRYVTDRVKQWSVEHGTTQTPTLQMDVSGDPILVRTVDRSVA